MSFRMLNSDVYEAIEKHYDEYEVHLKDNSKLRFVKLIKEHTGVSLKEAKENVDKIFEMSLKNFKDNFSVKSRRKEKLLKLKSQMFSTKIVEVIKDKDKKELEDSFKKMDCSILEEILENII